MDPKLEDQLAVLAPIVVPSTGLESSPARGDGGDSQENLLCTACGFALSHGVVDTSTSRLPHESDPEVCHICGLLKRELPFSDRNTANEITPPSPSTEGWLKLVATAIRLQAATGGSIDVEDCLTSWAHSVSAGSSATKLPPARALISGGFKREQVSLSGFRVGGVGVKIEGDAVAAGFSSRQPLRRQNAFSLDLSDPESDEEPHATAIDRVNSLSIDTKMPQGPLGSALAKIRGTVNKYTKSMSEPWWLVAVKLPTLQALARRLSVKKHEVLGHENVDLDISFRQLYGRVKSQIKLYKGFKLWADTQKDSSLIELLPPMDRLQPFLKFVNVDFAADLQICFHIASFHKEFASNGRVVDAMRTIDL